MPGNDNGLFDPSRVNFAQSAKDVMLDGTILHAQLKAMDGNWRRSSVDVSSLADWSSGTLVARRSCKLPTLQLLDASTLVATAPSAHGGHTETVIDLNTWLGNANGSFDSGGERYSLSARNVTLNHTTLHAELKTPDGQWMPSSIDLTDAVRRSARPLSEVSQSGTSRAKIYYEVGTSEYKTWADQITRTKLCSRG